MRALALIAIAVLTARCGAGPCTHCPDVAGTYAITAAAPSTSCDGTPAAALPAIANLTTLTLTQDRSHVSSGLMAGDLTDDGDFALHGASSDATQADVTLSARFSEPGTLRGQTISNFTVEGPRMRDPDLGSAGPLIQTWVTCSTSVSFTGARGPK